MKFDLSLLGKPSTFTEGMEECHFCSLVPRRKATRIIYKKVDQTQKMALCEDCYAWNKEEVDKSWETMSL